MGNLRPQQLKEYQAALEKGPPPAGTIRAGGATAASGTGASGAKAPSAGSAGGGRAGAGPGAMTGGKGKDGAVPPAARSGGGGSGHGGPRGADAGAGAAVGRSDYSGSEEGDDEDIEDDVCQFCLHFGPGATPEQLDMHYFKVRVVPSLGALQQPASVLVSVCTSRLRW